MASPYGIKTLIRRTFARRYAVARLTRRPLFGNMVDRLLFEGDDLMVLPRDQVIPVNQSLAPRKDMAVPSQVLAHFIGRARFHWKMDFCICRDAAGCQDYPADMGCLFLGDAARHINPKFGRRVSAEEAMIHARRCRDLGLVHLIGRNKLDSVWLNAGPAERLLTVCNCCPCCCLWKVLPEISPVIGGKLTRMPGIAVAVNASCTGCGTCTRAVCFVDAISIKDGRAFIGEGCRGCGRCIAACPSQAIGLQIEDAAYIEKAVRRIAAVVDVAG